MIRRYWPIVLPLLLAAAGCQTSAEAVSTVNAAWVGRPADDFFSRYGAPYASFPRQDGGAIYSWRGGEQTLAVNTAPRPPAFPPSPFGTAPAVQPASAPLFGDTKSRTTSNSWVRADGTKELVAIGDGFRESAESWADLLRDCKRLTSLRSRFAALQ